MRLPDLRVVRSSSRARGGLLVALALAAGCLFAPSDDEIRDDFAAYVAARNQCQEPGECAVAFPGCPLGCHVAVRADQKEDVERKARELIRSWERGGSGCQYECAEPGTVACVESRCALLPP